MANPCHKNGATKARAAALRGPTCAAVDSRRMTVGAPKENREDPGRTADGAAPPRQRGIPGGCPPDSEKAVGVS